MPSDDTTLETAIADLYHGPLNEFVARRDTLAKELRSAGDRESAAIIKNLRKPSRPAWALDVAAASSPDALAALVDVVAELHEAEPRGVDIRSAITRLQAAVREFASRAAHFSAQAGQPVETGALANAMLAVLGQPDSFGRLRRGCLVEVPEAGGLELLASLPPALTPVAPTRTATTQQDEGNAQAAASEQAQREAVALANQRLIASQRTLQEAETKLQAAEQQLREAEDAVREARSRRDRAREAAETAAAGLHRPAEPSGPASG